MSLDGIDNESGPFGDGNGAFTGLKYHSRDIASLNPTRLSFLMPGAMIYVRNFHNDVMFIITYY